MMDDVLKRLLVECGWLASARELSEAERAGVVRSIGEGHLKAIEALRTFKVRRRSTAEGQIETSGFDETLDALEHRDPDELVSLAHFATPNRVYTVFVSPARDIIGCIRVNTNNERAVPV